MGMRELLLSLMMAGCAVEVSHAALVVPVQQTLSRSSYAGKGTLRLSDNPPDVLVGNVYGVQTVSTKSEHLNYPTGFEGETKHVFATASMTTTVREDGISTAVAMDCEDHNEWFGPGNADARVVAKITFDVTQSAAINLAVDTMHYTVSWVKLTGPAGEVFSEMENGWAMTWPPFEPAHARVALALDPGRYVLDIDCMTSTHLSTRGPGTMDFSMVAVPEPAAVGVVGLGLLALRRRRFAAVCR